MFCQNCGNELSPAAAFCPKCGSKTPVQTVQAPYTAPAKPSFLPPGMELINGNTFHWRYAMDMKKDTRSVKIIEIVFLAVLGFIGLVIFFENLRYGFGEALKMLLYVFLIPFAVLSVITVISWFLLIAIKGGKHQMEFFMNESSVLYSDTLQSFSSKFTDVKSIKTHRKINMIGVNGVVQKNTIYASPEQYEFVLNYIVSHCPQAVKKLDK